MFAKRYRFNPETFQFEVHQWSFRRTSLRALGVVVAGCFLAAGVLAVKHAYWGNIEEVMLERKHARHMQTLREQNQTFAQLEQKVDRLHKKDNSFYRSILNVDRVDPAIWQGGIGGGENSEVNAATSPMKASGLRIQQLAHKIKLQNRSLSKLQKLAKNRTEQLKHIPAIRPVPGIMVSDYGMRRNPFHGHREFHEGLDFRAKTGTPIKVVGNGIVTEAGRPQSGYGLQVEVDHGHGYITKYAHCSKLMVNRGDTVQRGDVIALSGNTGYSTGPHLHYEVLKNGKKVNPRDYFYSD